MSNDRELLEAAAKAAGVEMWHEDVFTNGLTQKVSANGILMWNPILKDCDALRLAVKCSMEIEVNFDRVDVTAPSGYVATEYLYELPSPTDPYAATRRAIVRAAAEIGRSMK